jgi:hypothetical protein
MGSSTSTHQRHRRHRSNVEPENIEQYANDYNSRALWPMIDWIRETARQPNHFFQYQEVIKELSKYSPLYGCALIFARLVLLPVLANYYPISHLPESLIVVLNTLHLGTSRDISLFEVQKQGIDLGFTIQFNICVQGKKMKQIRSYLLRNYEYLSWTGLELLQEYTF